MPAQRLLAVIGAITGTTALLAGLLASRWLRAVTGEVLRAGPDG